MHPYICSKCVCCPFIAGGALIGFGFGVCTRLLLRIMRRWGATSEQQIAITLAGVYLAFYTANSPAHVSGGLAEKIDIVLQKACVKTVYSF